MTTAPACSARSSEQVELLAAQLELRAVERARAAPRGRCCSPPIVERLVGRLRAAARVGGAAQHRADARDDLRGRERLDDVVVGADLEADDAVGLGPARGEHDDRHVASGGAARGRRRARRRRGGSGRAGRGRARAPRTARARSATVPATCASKPSRASRRANGSAIEVSSSTSRMRGWATRRTVSAVRRPICGFYRGFPWSCRGGFGAEAHDAVHEAHPHPHRSRRHGRRPRRPGGRRHRRRPGRHRAPPRPSSRPPPSRSAPSWSTAP